MQCLGTLLQIDLEENSGLVKNKEAELAASANLSVQTILLPQLQVSAAHQGVCWTKF